MDGVSIFFNFILLPYAILALISKTWYLYELKVSRFNQVENPVFPDYWLPEFQRFSDILSQHGFKWVFTFQNSTWLKKGRLNFYPVFVDQTGNIKAQIVFERIPRRIPPLNLFIPGTLEPASAKYVFLLKSAFSDGTRLQTWEDVTFDSSAKIQNQSAPKSEGFETMLQRHTEALTHKIASGQIPESFTTSDDYLTKENALLISIIDYPLKKAFFYSVIISVVFIYVNIRDMLSNQ